MEITINRRPDLENFTQFTAKEIVDGKELYVRHLYIELTPEQVADCLKWFQEEAAIAFSRARELRIADSYG